MGVVHDQAPGIPEQEQVRAAGTAETTHVAKAVVNRGIDIVHADKQ